MFVWATPPPQAARVTALMDDLFKYLNDNDHYSFLIKACVFHYEFEFIHPFEDGNGRMGRLWQQLLLMKHHSIFEYISLETLIKHHQEEYYQVLSQCDQTGESTTFIEFMLKMILQTLQEYGQSKPKLPNTPEERLEYAKEILKTDIFARQDYMKLHNNISSATASRDLEFAVKNKSYNQAAK